MTARDLSMSIGCLRLRLCDFLLAPESLSAPRGTSLLGGGTRFAFPPSNARRKRPQLAACPSRAGHEPRAATKGAYPLGFLDARLFAASLVEPSVPAVPPIEKSRWGPPPLGGLQGRFRRLFEITYLEMLLIRFIRLFSSKNSVWIGDQIVQRRSVYERGGFMRRTRSWKRGSSRRGA